MRVHSMEPLRLEDLTGNESHSMPSEIGGSLTVFCTFEAIKQK